MKDGENGVRAALQRITRAQREAVVRALHDMAAAARGQTFTAAGAVPIQAETLLTDVSRNND